MVSNNINSVISKFKESQYYFKLGGKTRKRATTVIKAINREFANETVRSGDINWAWRYITLFGSVKLQRRSLEEKEVITQFLAFLESRIENYDYELLSENSDYPDFYGELPFD